MKLLIDECLSEELTKRARERGHVESSHVRWIGQGGAKPPRTAGRTTLHTETQVQLDQILGLESLVHLFRTTCICSRSKI